MAGNVFCPPIIKSGRKSAWAQNSCPPYETPAIHAGMTASTPHPQPCQVYRIKNNAKNLLVGRGFSRMPRRVPELSAGSARRGDAWMRRVDEGAGSPYRQPPAKARNAGNKRHPGRLFFGYFLLAEQKKVARLSVREPTLNLAVAPATQYFVILQIQVSTKIVLSLPRFWWYHFRHRRSLLRLGKFFILCHSMIGACILLLRIFSGTVIHRFLLQLCGCSNKLLHLFQLFASIYQCEELNC